ncbi:hypothetical protein BC830DRAFT_1118419 [Chytriomyces sp. MP71]|nr:hypothetical protein BC830DRAFT_1118419 [Chytriomyces sp. MP71]
MADCCACLPTSTNKVGNMHEPVTLKEATKATQPEAQLPMISVEIISTKAVSKAHESDEDVIGMRGIALGIIARPSFAIDDADFMDVIADHNQENLDMDEETFVEVISEDAPPEPIKNVERSASWTVLDMFGDAELVPTTEINPVQWADVQDYLTDDTIDFDTANKALSEVLETLITTLDGKALVSAQSSLIKFYTRRGQFAKAAEMGLTLTAHYRRLNGDRNPNVAILLFNTAQSCLDAGNFKVAHTCLVECCRNAVVADNKPNANLAPFFESLWENAQRLGAEEVEHAKRVLLESLDVLENRLEMGTDPYPFSATHPADKNTFTVMKCIWKAMVAQGNLHAAAPIIAAALTAMDQVFPDDHEDVCEAQWELARIHLLQGNVEAAKPLLEVCSQANGHVRQAVAKYALACVFITERKLDTASFMLAECMSKLFTIDKKKGGLDATSQNSALVLNTFCHLRFLQRQYAEVMHLVKPLMELGRIQAATLSPDLHIVAWLKVGHNMNEVTLSRSSYDFDANIELMEKTLDVQIVFTEEVDPLFLMLAKKQSWIWRC